MSANANDTPPPEAAGETTLVEAFTLCPKCAFEVPVEFGITLHDMTSSLQTCPKCTASIHTWVRIPTDRLSALTSKLAEMTKERDEALLQRDLAISTSRHCELGFKLAKNQQEQAESALTAKTLEADGLRSGLRAIQDLIWNSPTESDCAAYAIADRLLTGTSHHVSQAPSAGEAGKL
jgi:hypothetical protein